VAQPRQPAADLQGLRLDPQDAQDLSTIVALQGRLLQLAEQLGTLTVLLDVPPRITPRQVLAWGRKLRSARAAAYHPWLRTSRAPAETDSEPAWVNPAAVAAGIIAQRELAEGIPRGPANVLALGILDVSDSVSPSLHDQLHPAGINVFLRERDGFRLAGARTLSSDPAFRQLSVRRLVTMLRRTLDQQLQWVVFEPNNQALRAELVRAISAYLRQLYQAHAFRGATEEQAFFVRCDDELNPSWLVDAGRLSVEIGVAPAEPLEFVVLRLERGTDGTLTVEV
jgi:phage tail sheath protein FI